MTYVIGDIHGEYAKLLSLLKYIPEGEKLVFIGDYIDKGKDSRLVVDYLKKMKRKAVFLLGNHEFKLLKALAGDKKAKAYLKEYGFKPTLESYRGGKISQKEFERLLESGQFRSLLRTDLPFSVRSRNTTGKGNISWCTRGSRSIASASTGSPRWKKCFSSAISFFSIIKGSIIRSLFSAIPLSSGSSGTGANWGSTPARPISGATVTAG